MTYHNIGTNKKGDWIGTPVKVERCIKDVILVDIALNDSTLSPADEQCTVDDMPEKASHKSDDTDTPEVDTASSSGKETNLNEETHPAVGTTDLDPESESRCTNQNQNAQTNVRRSQRI